MSTGSQPGLRIRVVDTQVSQRAPGQWQLAVTWRFENQGDATLYVLLAAPLQFQVAEPLVLDHTAHWPPDILDVNADLGFSFLALAAQQAAEHSQTYQLALPAATAAATIVGRFGYSDVIPDPTWVQSKNWQQVAHWQQVVDAQAYTVHL